MEPRRVSPRSVTAWIGAGVLVVAGGLMVALAQKEPAPSPLDPVLATAERVAVLEFPFGPLFKRAQGWGCQMSDSEAPSRVSCSQTLDSCCAFLLEAEKGHDTSLVRFVLADCVLGRGDDVIANLLEPYVPHSQRGALQKFVAAPTSPAMNAERTSRRISQRRMFGRLEIEVIFEPIQHPSSRVQGTDRVVEVLAGGPFRESQVTATLATAPQSKCQWDRAR